MSVPALVDTIKMIVSSPMQMSVIVFRDFSDREDCCIGDSMSA
jgi:hypothetical protein